MKKGFLNTDKAKRKLDTEIVPNSPRDEPKSAKKSKGKEKAQPKSPTDADADHTYRTPIDLHSVPRQLLKKMGYSESEKKRMVFRTWPRDPSGKSLVENAIRGKRAGNGLDLWGATLYDFYHVRRVPDLAGFITISTGSKLAAEMKDFSELDAAKDEFAWAEQEEFPRELPAWDPGEATTCYESRVQGGYFDAFSSRKEVREKAAKSNTVWTTPGPYQLAEEHRPSEDEDNEMDTASESSESEAEEDSEKPAEAPKLDVPVDSPFHSIHYPSPWPLIPFENPFPLYSLQRSIPLHLLPKKLRVHDPWNLLSVDGDPEHDSAASWTSKKDIVRTCILSLSPESQKAANEAAKAAAEIEDAEVMINEAVMILPQEEEGPTEEPAVLAVLPQRPRKLTEIPEAHLYISPQGKLGEGHHSVVYKAEWELPRDLFCESAICKTCVDEKVRGETKRMKESGEWEQQLREAQKARGTPDGDSGEDPSAMDVDPSGSESPKKKKVGTTNPAMVTPPVVTVREPKLIQKLRYEGPTITTHPDVKYQNTSYPETICEHRRFHERPVPRTAMFEVAAKLSMPGDEHLAREARNYLDFPPHFFQHWNGYNVVPPLRDPTPLGALVPQFNGYYVPRTRAKREYRSPILLIEDCGQPVDPDKLCEDDRQECAALLFRFHHAGWLHESFAARNIVVQEGLPTTYPLERMVKPTLSFRLIDFGRSRQYSHSSARMSEEREGQKLFRLHPYAS
ncbi:hypothetical protein HYDPIDRAFT_33544 [Hydnomerulius pinastri MD-312]|uniref:Protein kinase domain-containing protein n=1 Tax=Hydnomerulius pinastri MD-312 TaxID=994086 RepID=A0A0C9W8L0_9AGAM|nr:hypothetical protein HYDPIDRAFT_33544 [Hydnomerulius pinastri MD-312]